MISLPTAKLLFFIALALGPKDATTVYATSNSESYVWTQSSGNWELRTRNMPHDDWKIEGQQVSDMDGHDATLITHHHWHDGGFVDLQNGDRVEQQGNAAFYIVSPGAPNQKVYTILYPQE